MPHLGLMMTTMTMMVMVIMMMNQKIGRRRKIVPSPFTPSFCALPTAGYLYLTLQDNGLVMKPCVSINLIFTWLGICPHKSRKVL